MDGQNFDPKFGTQIPTISPVVKPITDRKEFIAGLVTNQNKPKATSWFNVNNLVEDSESIAEQTGASEFAAGVIRNKYDVASNKKLSQDLSPGVDETLVAPSYYNPTQDNKWLYGSNLSVTRYEALRRAVGLKDGQSFTDYYNVNKFVPSGFELDAQLLLREEKIKALETQMLEGKMGYDTFLYRAYGKDLLKANGHDLDSSLYWYSRRKQGQYDSIKNNLTYMDQVLRSAERTYLAEEWNRTSSGMTIDTLQGAVASDKPISPELMRDLFPQLFDALDDTVGSDRKIMDLFLAGQIGRDMLSPYIDADGDGQIDYYLHVNGRLYSAKEESVAGDKDARVRYNNDGTVKEIYLPGAWSFDSGVTESALTSFAKVFWGIPEFIGLIFAGAWDLTGDALIDGNFDMDSLGDWYIHSNKFQNSSTLLSNEFFIADQNLINKDGDVNWMNTARGIAEASGMIAGMLTLANVGALLGKSAAIASNVFSGTNLSASQIAAAGNATLKLFGPIKGAIPRVIYGLGSMAKRLSMIKNGAPLLANPSNMWGMSLEAAGYLAVRDFLTTGAELTSRQKITGLSDEDIFARTLEMTTVNFAISSVFRSVNDSGITDRFAQLLKGKKIANSVLTNLGKTGLDKAWTGYVSNFTKFTPVLNTLSDMVENWATMAMNIGVSMNAEDYSFGESIANLVAGSGSMVNNPSAMAMQLVQGWQTFYGSVLPRGYQTGQLTRGVTEALQLTGETMNGVENRFRQAIAAATGNERVALQTVYNKWLDIRQHEYEFKVNPDGDITWGNRKLDKSGKPIKTSDPDANDVASLMWLQKTLTGQNLTKGSARGFKNKDLDLVSEELKKVVDLKNIENFVSKHQIVFGAYNSYMDKRQEKFEQWLKNPKEVKLIQSKGFNLYKRMESLMGRKRDDAKFLETNKLTAAGRERIFNSLAKIASSNFKDAYLTNDINLLENNPSYATAVDDAQDLIELVTREGRLQFDKLTKQELLNIIQRRNKATGVSTKIQSFNQNDKEYLIRYIATNFTTDELQSEIARLQKNPANNPDSGSLIIRVKGEGSAIDQPKRNQLIKYLDILVYWEDEAVKATDGAYQPMISKVKDGTYVVRNQLENESLGLNLVDYIGYFVRSMVGFKLQTQAGTNIGLKENILNSLMDRFNVMPLGTFKNDLADPAKRPAAQKQANDFLNLFVEKGILTYEEAASIYRDEFSDKANIADKKSVARFVSIRSELASLVEDKTKMGDTVSKEWSDRVVKLLNDLDNSSKALRDALFKATGLSPAVFEKMKKDAAAGFLDLKKALGNLLSQRLQARLAQAGSPGTLESLSVNELAKLVLEEISNATYGRTVGLNEVTFKETNRLVLDGIKKLSVFTKLSQEANEAASEIIKDLYSNPTKLDDFLFGDNEFLVRTLAPYKLNQSQSKEVVEFLRELKINVAKELSYVYATKVLNNSNPTELQKKLKKAIAKDLKNPSASNTTLIATLKEDIFNEYVDDEFERRTIGLNLKFENTEQKLNWLLSNDPFFLRNAGDQTAIANDESVDNSLLGLTKSFIELITNGSVDTPTTGKVYVNLNSFVGAARRQLFNFIGRKDVKITTPISTKLNNKILKDVLSSIGFADKDISAFSLKIMNEYKFIKNKLAQNPSGVIVFDLDNPDDAVRLNEFLIEAGYKKGLSVHKNKLQDFGIYGFPPDGNLSKTRKTFDLVIDNKGRENDPITYSFLVNILKNKEKEFFERQRKNFTTLTESYVSRTNASFQNTVFINNDTVITNPLGIILSTLNVIDNPTLDNLTKTIGSLVEGNKVKFGKLGGLAEAIRISQEQLSITGSRNNDLFNFKLIKTLANFLFEYSSSNSRKFITLKLTDQDIKNFQATNVWDIVISKDRKGKDKVILEGKTPYKIVNLTIKSQNENEFFASIVKWIKQSKNNIVDFNFLLPNTTSLSGSSSSTSPKTVGKIESNVQESPGTGDSPFTVLRNSVGYGINLEEILKNKFIFDLSNYELTAKSFEELDDLSGLSIKQIISRFKNTKNPYIRMAINTLTNGVKLNELYLNQVSSRLTNVSKSTLQALMHPKIRQVFGKVLGENQGASLLSLTRAINKELASVNKLTIEDETSISSLEQYGLTPKDDFINSSTLGSMKPENKFQPVSFNEQDVKVIKDFLDDEMLVSSEENEAIYNPFSNLKNMLVYSNDTNINPTNTQLKSQGGQVVKFDVESMFNMSDEELFILADIIKNLGSSFKSSGVLLDKIKNIVVFRGRTSRPIQQVQKVQSLDTPANILDRTLITNMDGDTIADKSFGVKAQDYGSTLKNRGVNSFNQTQRIRLNNVLNNPDYASSEPFARYLENELRNMGENSSVGQRMILDLSKADNLGRYVFNQASTAKVLLDLIFTKDKGFEGTRDEGKLAALNLAKQMNILTDGSDYVSMATKYLFVDRKTGNIINRASLLSSQENPAHLNDFFAALFSSIKDQDGTNIVVIELNKNMMTGAGSLSDEKFNYIEINDSNKQELLSLAYSNIKHQARDIEELQSLTDPVEIVAGLLSRNVTRRDYEASFFEVFKKALNNTDNPEFKIVASRLVGQLFDTIFHDDGTYTTQEMYEARDLGFEFGDDDKFDALISNRDKKISEIITYFVNDESLPDDIKSFFSLLGNDVDQFFYYYNLSKRQDVTQLSILERTKVENAVEKVNQARQVLLDQKQSKRFVLESYNNDLKLASEALYDILDEQKDIKDKLKNVRTNIKNEQNDFTNKLRDTYLNFFNLSTNEYLLKKLENIPELKSLAFKIRSKNITLKELNSIYFILGEVLNNKYLPVFEQNKLNKKLDKDNARIVNDIKTLRVLIEDELLSSEGLLTKVQKDRSSNSLIMLKQLRNELELNRSELEDFKANIKQEKQSVIQEKLKVALEKEKEIKESIAFLQQEEKLLGIVIDKNKYVQSVLFSQKNAYSIKSSYFNQFIDGKQTLSELSSIILTAKKYFEQNKGPQSGEEFVEDAFDELAIRYIFNSKNADAINFKLLKLLSDSSGVSRKNLLSDLLKKSKSNKINDFFTNILLNDVQNPDTKTNLLFDLEAFFNDTVTSPFSVSFSKLKKISSVQLTDLLGNFNAQAYRNNWEDFSKKFLSPLIENTISIFVPVYKEVIIGDKKTYELIRTRDQIRSTYPNYVSEFHNKHEGAEKETDNYLRFVNDPSNNFKTTLTEKEFKNLMEDYVGKKLTSLGIDFNKTRLIGFNNKEFDNGKLTNINSNGKKDNVGYTLIKDKNIFNESLDIYNDIIRGLGASSGGLKNSLDELRKRYGVDLSKAHSTEDDVLFTLFTFLDQSNKLVDSFKNQSHLISLLSKIKSSFGIKGELTEQDLQRIEGKIDAFLKNNGFDSVKLKENVSERSLVFAKLYDDIYKKGNVEISKFQKELMESQQGLFREQEFKKNFEIYTESKKDATESTKRMARLASNDSFKKNIGVVFDFAISKVFKILYNGQAKSTDNLSDITFKMNYVDPKSKISVYDIVIYGLTNFAKTYRDGSTFLSNQERLQRALEEQPEILMMGIFNQINRIPGLEKVKELIPNDVEFKKEFDDYKQKNPIIVNADFTRYFDDNVNYENAKTSKQNAQTLRSLVTTLSPIIENFANIEDPAIRNLLIKETMTMLTYNIDDDNIKGRMSNFGKNRVLTNIDKQALFSVLDSLAATKTSYRSMMEQAQSLSVLSSPLKVYTLNESTDRYTSSYTGIDNKSYYMSKSKFLSMFNISANTDIDLAIKTVRKRYNLNADQKLYISILRQPSDKLNTLHNYELKIIEDNQGISSTITLDALQSNHSGDTDGDKLFIFKPTMSQLTVANNITQYQRAALDLIGEAMLKTSREQSVVQFDFTKEAERLKNFDLANQLLAKRVSKDYEKITDLTSKEKQLEEYQIRKEIVKKELLKKGISPDFIDEIVNLSWLSVHDVSETNVKGSGLLFTSNNQQIQKSEWNTFQNNVLQLHKYIFKNKLGEIDSVTGLYKFNPEDKSITIENKNSGLGRLFETTGIHLNKGSLVFIKNNAGLIVKNMIELIRQDKFLKGVYINRVLQPDVKRGNILASDYLIQGLESIDLNREDRAILIQTAVEAYDIFVRSSKDYNNTLFALSQDKLLTNDSPEYQSLIAVEKRQVNAIKDLLFAEGINIDQNINANLLNNLPTLLDYVNQGRFFDNTVRFSNPNLEIASKLILNEIANSQKRNDVVLFKDTIGNNVNDFTNIQKTKTIYSVKGIKNIELNSDVTFTLPKANNLTVLDMDHVFFEETDSLKALDILDDYGTNKKFVVPTGGLKIKEGFVIPEGTELIVVATSKSNPDFLENVNTRGEIELPNRPFVVFGYVNKLSDPSVINNYKINIPGSKKQKSTLMPFNAQMPKGFDDFVNNENIHFFRYLDNDIVDKSNTISQGQFKYYDENFNEIKASDKKKIAYVVEENNITIQENTKNWRSNSPSDRFFDGPSVINNIGNPEAFFMFGRLNKLSRITFNQDGTITASINNKQLNEIQDGLANLRLNDVQEGNGLRLMHIFMAKVLIYNPSLKLTEQEKSNYMYKILNSKNLNNVSGYIDISNIFRRLYNTPELKENWSNFINSNNYYKKLFSKELHDSIFVKTPTEITAPKRGSKFISTKSNVVEQNIAAGFIQAQGGLVSLRASVKNYDTLEQTGENTFVDGYAYIGHVDLINQLLLSDNKSKNSKLNRNVINSLAPYLGARKLVGNTFASQYRPLLTTDVENGKVKPYYGGIVDPKTGIAQKSNSIDILVQSEQSPLLPIEPKDNITDMYSKDSFTIDEGFFVKILSYYKYNDTKKAYEFDNKSFYEDYGFRITKGLMAEVFKDSKNFDEKLSHLSSNYDRFALQFNLARVIDDKGNIRVTINQSKASGTLGDLKDTLRKNLGSVYYFDRKEAKAEELKGKFNFIKTLLESKLNADWADVSNKIEMSDGFKTTFEEFLKERNVYLKQKELARQKFLQTYKSMFYSADNEDLLKTELETNMFNLNIKLNETPARDPHSIKVGFNKNHTIYVDKNLNEEDVIKLDKLKLTSSGISEEDKRSFEVSQIVTLLKKEPQQLNGYFLSRINTIKDMVYKFGLEDEFNEYMWVKGHVYKLIMLQSQLNVEQDAGKKVALEDQMNNILVKFNVKSISELNTKASKFEEVYGDVATDIQRLTTDIYNAQNITSRNANEPIPDIYWLILPTIKAGTGKDEYEFAKNIILNPRERILSDNGHAVYAGYNFFRSIETTVSNLSRHIAAENFSARATSKGVLSNLPVVNFLIESVLKFVTSEQGKNAIDNFENKNYYYEVFKTFQNTMKGTLKFANNDLDAIFIKEDEFEKTNVINIYLKLLNNIDAFIIKNGGMTLSEASATMKREQPETLVYNKAHDMYYLQEYKADILARVNELMGGDTLSKYLYNELNSFANSKGYSLADKYGRRQSNKIDDIRPLSNVSMEWLSGAINNNVRELGGFEKNLITRALGGDVYLMDTKLQDHLMKYFYTVKVPNNFLKIVRKLQSLATTLIMSNPFKIVDRILKYSLTDLTMMSLANPKTMFKVNDARKDLSAFMQSKGAVVSDTLKKYLNTQGVDLTKTNFDYVLNDAREFEEKGTFFKKYFDSLGKPFEFQTQLIRYAYWLQTVEDLNNGKSNVYGSAYYKKNLVDGIEDVKDSKGNVISTANEAKASYLMSQQLGAPGDFPLLARDLNGIFMFTTFPLALVRWAKGEANSMATAVKNLFVEGEQKQALSWLATQGGGILGSMLLVQGIISLLASIFNVDEETEEEWIQKQALPDFFATLIQGAPVMDIYNTADPIKLLSELTYAPFVEAAKENQQDALYGKPDDKDLTRGNGLLKWVFQNVLGKVNPAFKDPIETVLGISSLGGSVYLQDGPGYENFLRKMSAYIFGGSGSRALNRYIGSLDPTDPITLDNVFNGLNKVLMAELGNTKAYKGDIKNFYKALNNLKNFTYLESANNSITSGSSSNFDRENYNTLKDKLRALFNEKAEFSQIYKVAIEHLESGGSLQELRSALNNVTITGQLSKLPDAERYTETLDDKELFELERAIVYEEENFPWLNEFRESIRQRIEEQYYADNNYFPRYYQPYRKFYGDSKNVYYRPYYSKFLQNPFKAYRSAWYDVNGIERKDKS